MTNQEINAELTAILPRCGGQFREVCLKLLMNQDHPDREMVAEKLRQGDGFLALIGVRAWV